MTDTQDAPTPAVHHAPAGGWVRLRLEACTSRRDNRQDSFPLWPLGLEGGRTWPWAGRPVSIVPGSPASMLSVRIIGYDAEHGEL